MEERARSLVTNVLGWTNVGVEDKSGHGGSKTYKVTAPGKDPVALHCLSADAAALSTSALRQAAASAHFVSHALAPQRLAEGDGYWFERWDGSPVGTACQLNNGLSKVVLVAGDSPGRLVFEHAQALREPFPSTGCLDEEPAWEKCNPVVGPFATSSAEVPLTVTSHKSMAVGMQAPVVFGPFHLQGPVLVDAPDAGRANFDGAFLTSADGFVLDVAHVEHGYHANQELNWLKELHGGDEGDATRRVGGARDWAINDDGTLSPRHARHLVMGVEEGGAQATASVEELGALLGKIHALPTAWYDPWREALVQQHEGLDEASAGSTVWWHTARPVALLEALPAPALRRWLRACPRPRTQAGARVVTAHADFHPANVLRTAAGALCAIDFEYTCVTSACQDIAWALLLWLKGAENSRAFVRSYLTQLGEAAGKEDVDALLLDAHAWRLGLVFGGEGGLYDEAQALVAAPDGELLGGLTAALVAVVDEARSDAALRDELIAKGSILGTARGMAVKAHFEATASTAAQTPSQ